MSLLLKLQILFAVLRTDTGGYPEALDIQIIKYPCNQFGSSKNIYMNQKTHQNQKVVICLNYV